MWCDEIFYLSQALLALLFLLSTLERVLLAGLEDFFFFAPPLLFPFGLRLPFLAGLTGCTFFVLFPLACLKPIEKKLNNTTIPKRITPIDVMHKQTPIAAGSYTAELSEESVFRANADIKTKNSWREAAKASQSSVLF